ncbi:MAG TPA: phage tail protein [Kofleriaceae bacterium]|nr:phage tail protein [Kofleriaceae bacterium]
MLPKGTYTSGHFELEIDGHPTTAYLKSVEGGFVHANVIAEPIGPDNHRVMHTSTVEIDPFTVDFGISGANDVLLWIQSSWRKDWSRRNGQITHANFDLYKTFEHEFYDALISETTFPTLDGASKEAAYIKIKVQPEAVVSKKADGSKTRVNSTLGSKQKLWMLSGFRLNIDGITNAQYTNKIESFTIKQGIQKFYTGASRFPQIEPTKIDFPKLTCSIGLNYASELIDWYDAYVVKGGKDPKQQKTGSLEFLSPDRASVLFRLNLYEVGLPHLQILPSKANAEDIKRVKYELFVGRMDLDGSGALGME